MKIAVLITSFNRVATTIRGLHCLFEAIESQSLAEFKVFLVDDASPDQTGAAVSAQFPQIAVIPGPGNLYWNRGMCLAYASARAAGCFDAYLLFNDDVEIIPEAFHRMLARFAERNRTEPAAITGPTCARATGETTYAGFRSVAKYRPMTFERVLPDGTLRECDAFNGNCVLVPGSQMDSAGGLDPAYHHSFGDIDLGLTLKKRGCKIYLFSEHVGYCESNSLKRKTSFLLRLKGLYSAPFPVSDQFHLTFKRYAWPVAFALASFQLAKRLAAVATPQREPTQDAEKMRT